MSYHTVSASFHGRKHSVLYWADGNGIFFEGFVTSLAQLRRSLAKHFGVRDLDLYVVSDLRKRPITTDRHMRQELERLPTGASLQLAASEHKGIEHTVKTGVRHGAHLKNSALLERTRIQARRSSLERPRSSTRYSKTRITWVPVVVAH